MSTFACRPKSLHRRICLATKSTRRGLRCGYRPARIILGVERVEVLIEPWSVDTRYRSRTNLSENKVLPIPSPLLISCYTDPCSDKRVSSGGPFYDGLRAARWRAERRSVAVQKRCAGRSSGLLSDADRQRVHRQHEKGQRRSAAIGVLRRHRARASCLYHSGVILAACATSAHFFISD
jgi:hypothetical protein